METGDKARIPGKWDWLRCWYHESFLLPNKETAIHYFCNCCLLRHVAGTDVSHSFNYKRSRISE
jgi:hypothetical protein